ncbi:MBL fold metallo-hydrolase [candidate division KSB1 bacterium]
MRKRQVILTVVLFISFLISFRCATEPDGDKIFIHYLGHSSFILNFNNELSVLTDYGESNSYGLDSPIYDFGDFIPDIETYSHTSHVDHFTDRIFEDIKYTLTDTAGLKLDDLTIRPVRVSELSLEEKDNSSFIFYYRGMTIVHLGDAQANIKNILDETNRAYLKEVMPEKIDVLLMTIQGRTEFIESAEIFIDFLKPAAVIPMHYWSGEYKKRFLDHLKSLNNTGRNYIIEEVNGPEYTIEAGTPDQDMIKIISLEAGPYEGKY